MTHLPQWASGELTEIGYLLDAFLWRGDHDSIPAEIDADKEAGFLDWMYNEVEGKRCE